MAPDPICCDKTHQTILTAVNTTLLRPRMKSIINQIVKAVGTVMLHVGNEERDKYGMLPNIRNFSVLIFLSVSSLYMFIVSVLCSEIRRDLFISTLLFISIVYKMKSDNLKESRTKHIVTSVSQEKYELTPVRVVYRLAIRLLFKASITEVPTRKAI